MVVFLEYINRQDSPSDRKKLEYCFSAAVHDFLYEAKQAPDVSSYCFQRYSRDEIKDIEQIAKEFGSMNGRPVTQRFMQEIIFRQHQEFVYDLGELLQLFYNEMFKKNKSPIIKGKDVR